MSGAVDAHSLDCGNCDLVARMLRVMNVLLMQFVITSAIRGCSRTQSLLVKHRHIGPAVMNGPHHEGGISLFTRENEVKAARPVNGEYDCGGESVNNNSPLSPQGFQSFYQTAWKDTASNK